MNQLLKRLSLNKVNNYEYIVIRVDKRTHIVPVGYDYYNRVLEPLLDPRADEIFFILHDKGAIRGHDKFFAQIVKEVKKENIPFESIETDIWDLYKCLEVFREIITDAKKHGNHVFINVSTGTKVTAMAGILACMMWRETPYYVRLKNPTKKGITKIPKVAVEKRERIPTFDITKPDIKMMKILQKIAKMKDGSMRKWQLVEYLEDEGDIKQIETRKKKVFTDNAKLSQLQTILIPMEKTWGFVDVEHRGSRSQVKIRKEGLQALQIFGVEEI